MGILGNPKHEAFAQALAKGLSAAEAYVQAGYKYNDGNAIRLKGNERVAARVAEILGRAADRAEATLERWTQEVAGIAFADIRDVLEFGPKGVRIKESATLRPEHAALISEVADTKDGQKLKLHSKLDALDKLAKRFGWYSPEKHEHTGADGGPIEFSDIELARRIGFALSKGVQQSERPN